MIGWREIAFPLLAFCEEHYSGQWSRLYRIMCRLTSPGRIRRGAAWSGFDSLSEYEKEIYTYLVERYGDDKR